MKALVLIGVLVVILAIVGGVLGGTYNSLVKKSTTIDAQWAQVETQYQRRYDLIPNLVNSVKGYMTQEKTIFDNLAAARTKYGSASTTDAKAVAGGELETALSRLLVVMENYPVLRSVEVITSLMDELAGTENRISVERGRYNTAVRDYNTAIKTFPGNMMAGMFGFTQHEYFTSVSGADQVPKVEF